MPRHRAAANCRSIRSQPPKDDCCSIRGCLASGTALAIDRRARAHAAKYRSAGVGRRGRYANTNRL